MIELSRDQQLTQYLIETVKGNSKFYDTFIESVKNVEILMEISIPRDNLRKTQNKMLYLNVIIAMETYLSDALINTVVNNNELIKKLLSKTPDFKPRKFTSKELVLWLDDTKRAAMELLLDISYHNIWKVKSMYKNVLEIDFPEDMEDIQKAVMIRHDIVHRNGKTKEGVEIAIIKENIKQIIVKAQSFIKNIDDQFVS